MDKNFKHEICEAANNYVGQLYDIGKGSLTITSIRKAFVEGAEWMNLRKQNYEHLKSWLLLSLNEYLQDYKNLDNDATRAAYYQGKVEMIEEIFKHLFK